MIHEVLQSIEGVHVYPIVSLFLFLVSFGLVVLWVMTMRRNDLQRWSRLPLDNGGDEPSEGGDR